MIEKFKKILLFLFLPQLMIVFCVSIAVARPDSFSSIVKKEKHKVVHISTSSIIKNIGPHSSDPFFDRFFPNMPKERKESALGSGFIISEDGYIMTNNHVVEKADKIVVVLEDERKFDATVIGKDKRTDLALIKISADDLPYVKLGDSDKLEIGDWVIAIGNPLGLDHSVTAGILSARGRDIFEGTAYGKFLQTDAAINPGNSGGPLFNVDGEVIGINTAIVAGGQGLGFAIPINLAKKIIDQLKKNGKITRGWLGVGIQDVTHELAESFGLPKGMKGVAITAVGADSPAEKAGIKQGDVVVKYNGKTVDKTTTLQQLVAETAPGAAVTIRYFRDNKFGTLQVVLGEAPDESIASLDVAGNRFGMKLVEINESMRHEYRIPEKNGLLVVDISQTGVAWEAGLRKGDIIVKVNRGKVTTNAEFLAIIKKTKKKAKSVSLLVKRQNRAIFLALPLK